MDRFKIYRQSDQFFSDGRGYAFFPFQGDEAPQPSGIDFSSLHIVKTLPGESRGNHQHPGTAEWLHICGARSEISWLEDGSVKKEVIDFDDTVIYVPEGVGHTITNIDTIPMIIMAFREKKTSGPHTRPLPVSSPGD